MSLTARHVHFLTAGRELSPEDLSSNLLASVRLRLAPAASAALDMGFTFTAGDVVPKQTTHIVIGKISKFDFEARKQHWLAQISAARLQGGVIFIDYTDHHILAGSELSPFYRDVIPMVDVIVVPTPYLEVSLKHDMAIMQPIVVIEEPIECDLALPAMRSAQRQRDATLWFGHDSNLPFLLDYLQRWPDSAPGQLHIVASKQALEIMRTSCVSAPRPIDITFHEWTATKVEEVSVNASTCIIPSATSSYKSFASSNRLVTSLALGLPTLASPIPSYTEFSQYYCSLESGLDTDFFKSPEIFYVAIEHFQNLFETRFSQEKIISDWAACFSEYT